MTEYVCLFVCLGVHVGVKGQLGDSALSFHHVGSRNQTLVARLVASTFPQGTMLLARRETLVLVVESPCRWPDVGSF